MVWISNLFDRLSGQVPQVPPIEHPRFGKVQPSHRPKEGLWLWETRDFLDTSRGAADVTFEADADGPTEAQEHTWDWILANLDALTTAAAPGVGSELSEWLERPFPSDPWDELEWEGAHLPGDAAPGGNFDLSYSSKSWPDAMITVHFEAGQPTIIQIDD